MARRHSRWRLLVGWSEGWKGDGGGARAEEAGGGLVIWWRRSSGHLVSAGVSLSRRAFVGMARRHEGRFHLAGQTLEPGEGWGRRQIRISAGRLVGGGRSQMVANQGAARPTLGLKWRAARREAPAAMKPDGGLIRAPATGAESSRWRARPIYFYRARAFYSARPDSEFIYFMARVQRRTITSRRAAQLAAG